MDDERLDQIFADLAEFKPRAPSKLVNDMVYTVNKLGEEKLRRFGAPAVQPKMQKKAAPRQKILGQKPPGRNL